MLSGGGGAGGIAAVDEGVGGAAGRVLGSSQPAMAISATHTATEASRALRTITSDPLTWIASHRAVLAVLGSISFTVVPSANTPRLDGERAIANP